MRRRTMQNRWNSVAKQNGFTLLETMIALMEPQ